MNAPRVLIVDDNAVNVELAAYLLAEAGMQVASVLDGRSMGPKVAAFQPDLVLMDMQLPDIDGQTLTAQLRGQPATRTLVIVAFTALAMKGDREKFLAGGCDGYIAKPIDVATFAAEVRGLLPASGRPPNT